MATTRPSTPRSAQDLLDALSRARDSARVQLHLLSLDARKRWEGLESQLDRMQSKIEGEGARASESASNKVRELTQTIGDFLRENATVPDLATPAKNLMKPARSCRPTETLNAAARLMWECDCGAIPVLDEAERLVGMITDRDICMAAYTRGQPLAALSVESAMSRSAISASAEAPLERIASLMREKQLRRIPIMDEGRLVGIVSLADVARHIESDLGFGTAAGAELIHTLAAISQPRSAAARSAAAE